jgi:multidrug resistance efflux pump
MFRCHRCRALPFQGPIPLKGGDSDLDGPKLLFRLERIAANETQIATIDSQLTRTILDNENQLDQLKAQIEQLEYSLGNQKLHAPVAGQVFNLQVSPGYVANASEPILEIVPDDTLVARVFITNRALASLNSV